ncbi:adenosylcobinamide kinase/adenosylcobinamide phosphate guanyltransferase [Vulcanimicrobium alpinum]|uniref:Adenosylcobinamide kinase n=1 Tax=Vulcanimicrobium alpinum TaxID=3016050 RepID=A0AAN1XZE3_UNVUL|nr:bifunctional adenosylcobinamide kinase/adenosylcobinamide-phosphate guanylyltransferase [Vulcanimicrobium alpinum]BDE07163.1 adenosylcobinamide kinase/adenosylcobinamide phosphate guanyltransferase [Vulcanimicrobium alpinum]
MLTLVLGPVRAGKSARAQALAHASGRPVLVAATAAVDPGDAEMVDRIERHRRDRPAGWTLVETAGPRTPSLVTVLEEAPPGSCVLIDALGTWIAAQLHEWSAWAERDIVATLDALDAQGAALADALARTAADAIVVAEETGWGVVPPTPLGRIFRDALGRMTQAIARRADRVELVVAGYAIDVRAIGTPVGEVRS